MKRHWGTDELVEHWTLLPRETELLTQIPKLGNRPRPRRRARFIGLLRREKSRSSWQLFVPSRYAIGDTRNFG
jgi:hypothetical protein